MVKTELCQLLGIEYPILQGGMAWVATAELAAAVSNGGGLGIIGAGHMPPEALRTEIVNCKKLTNKPFGVNVMLLSPYVKEVMQVVLEERVPVVTTGAGNPGEYIPALKEIGSKVIPVVASVALARRLERFAIDAIIAEGHESGGHIGDITTIALIPQIVDAVNVPVIAAGGIADSRGFVAALSLGAQGVQVGSKFVCATECTAHDNYKAAVIKAKDRSTIATGIATGHPVRVIENKLSREYMRMERAGASVEELEKLGEGKLRVAAREGDIDYGSVMIGQIAAMVDTIKPAAEIIQDIVGGADAIIHKLQSYVLK